MIQPKGRESYHHGNLYQALLDEAGTILENEGLSVLSLRELARRCQVSQTAPYRHFASKEHVMATLAEMGFERLLKTVHQAVQGTDDAVAALQLAGQGYVEFAIEHSAQFRLMFSELLVDAEHYPALQKARSSVLAWLGNYLEGSQVQLTSPASQFAAHAVAQWHGCAMLHLSQVWDRQSALAQLATWYQSMVREVVEPA